MNIGITGASGLIGRRVVDLALRRGHEVYAFSRHPERVIPGCTMRLFPADSREASSAVPSSPDSLALPDFSDCQAIVHLAGESVLGLWTPAKKRRIRNSRVLGTRRVVEAITQMPHPPEVLVSGSAIGLYGSQGDKILTESAPAGHGFLAETAVAWEHEAAQAPAERVVFLRTGIVLDRKGGALGLMTPAFRLGLGGPLGDGSQWMSWIHLEDLAALILFAVENTDLSGPVNGTAPWPERNMDFTRLLARKLHRPAPWRIPAFALRWLGDFSEELLGSKRVLPAVATEHGFPFRYPELSQALENLL